MKGWTPLIQNFYLQVNTKCLRSRNAIILSISSEDSSKLIIKSMKGLWVERLFLSIITNIWCIQRHLQSCLQLLLEHLTSTAGTEKDTVNCSCSFNIEACLHRNRSFCCTKLIFLPHCLHWKHVKIPQRVHRQLMAHMCCGSTFRFFSNRRWNTSPLGHGIFLFKKEQQALTRFLGSGDWFWLLLQWLGSFPDG